MELPNQVGESLLYSWVHIPAGYFAAVAGVLASALLVLIVPGGGASNTIAGELINEPCWAPVIIVGLLLGACCYKYVPSKLSFFAWLLPGIFLLWSAWSWQKTMSMYDSTWDTYFGKDCGGSECVYQLFVTVPFYSGLAYSLGAFVGWARINRREN